MKNPCRTSALARSVRYHPYPGDSRLFIQCDEQGKAFLKICPDGQAWDQTRLTCAEDGGHDDGSKGHKEVKPSDGRQAPPPQQEVPQTVHDNVNTAGHIHAGQVPHSMYVNMQPYGGAGVVTQQNARNSPAAVAVPATGTQPIYPGFPVQAAQYATLGVLPASPFLNLILMSAGNQIAAVSHEGVSGHQIPAQQAEAAPLQAAGNLVTDAVGAANPCAGSDVRFHPYAGNPTQYLECQVRIKL